MIKTVQPDSWEGGLGDDPVVFVKVSSRGLQGADYQEFAKRAGDETAYFVKHSANIDPDLQLPVHVVAMGSTENFGANRNGDGFRDAALQKYAGTFEKFAKAFRNHQNKPTDPHYGQVKKAYYNKPMQRVALLLTYNRNKEAADKYGRPGWRIGKSRRFESGRELPVSMACKIAYDVCSVCGNKARTRAEYCESESEGGSCPGFGCKHGLTKVSSTGHVQHVDNPEPVFFDISSVFRPADRIAYGHKADYLLKAAAVTGAELEKTCSADWLPDDLTGFEKIPDAVYDFVVKLAQIEQSGSWRQVAPFFSTAYDLTPLVESLGSAHTKTAARNLRRLHERQICLPATDFLHWRGVAVEKIAEVREFTPRMFSWFLEKAGERLALVNVNKKSSERLEPADAKLLLPLTLAAEKRAFTAASLNRQAALSIFNSAPSLSSAKPVELSPSTIKLAADYAGYLLEFLDAQPKTADLQLTLNLVVAQNHI